MLGTPGVQRQSSASSMGWLVLLRGRGMCLRQRVMPCGAWVPTGLGVAARRPLLVRAWTCPCAVCPAVVALLAKHSLQCVGYGRMWLAGA